MNIYNANEFVVALPDGLRDKTVHIFSLTDEGPSDLGVVVTRERPRSGETLERFAERMVTALMSKLPGFQVAKREQRVVGGQPAILTDYTFQTREGKMAQRQVLLYAKGPNQMLILTATCRDSLGARWEAMFDEFLAGFRLRA